MRALESADAFPTRKTVVSAKQQVRLTATCVAFRCGPPTPRLGVLQVGTAAKPPVFGKYVQSMLVRVHNNDVLSCYRSERAIHVRGCAEAHPTGCLPTGRKWLQRAQQGQRELMEPVKRPRKGIMKARTKALGIERKFDEIHCKIRAQGEGAQRAFTHMQKFLRDG
jgi:hypothetical protein